MALQDDVDKARAALRRDVEAPVTRTLIAQYERTADRLAERAEVVAARAQALMADGQDPFLALYEGQRLALLEEQTRNEVERIARRAAGQVTEAQRVALIRGVQFGEGTMRSLVPGVRLNAPAIERMTAAFVEDTPVKRLFQTLPELAQRRIRDTMIESVILGRNPLDVARAIRADLGGNAARANTIARTEILRTYRDSSLEFYQDNQEVVGGWMWISARDNRTCPVCWAMHGQTFQLGTPFASHPQCRCSAAPVPKLRAPRISAGPAVFARLPEPEQRVILGPSKFDAYRRGDLRLEDLVGQATHPQWGPVRFERSLTAAVASHEEAA